jgi:hypothetical protein
LNLGRWGQSSLAYVGRLSNRVDMADEHSDVPIAKLKEAIEKLRFDGLAYS